jgi:L-asparaginase II
MVESVHHVAACAIDAHGDVFFSLGDIDAPIYLRSSAKPFIAAAAIAAGVRERFNFEPHEIALMAASHSGEPFHVSTVRSMLEKIAMDESALQCGAHAPYNAAAARELERQGIAPSAVHNNCSGKHTGILALCKAIGADPSTYMQIDNPAQQQILAFCSRMSEVPVEDFQLGVDGCGIPVYAIPLRNAALSFMRFARLSGINLADRHALQIVRDAMVAHPEYVAGTGEFDTRVMQSASGKLACKSGAEAVHATAAIEHGAGLVVKVLDGASRGRGPAVLSALRQLGLLDEAALTKLADLERPVVYNRAGRPVGEVRATRTFAISEAR